MAWKLSVDSLLERAAGDPELLYRLTGFEGVIRTTIAPESVDLVVEAGRITARPAEGDARLSLTLPSELLVLAAQTPPPPLLQGIMLAQGAGAKIEGDMVRDVAPYLGAADRLFNLLRIAFGGAEAISRPGNRDPFSDTDTAVGRYLTITVDDVDYRIFYEESGSGEQALLLQHTAGADARQWRHQLADPEFQKRFRVIAYDLPFHGRSLPPTGQKWWTQPYKPTEQWLMKVVVAIADGLKLSKPLFMGCSVGGQLALDLAAQHGPRFGGFVALNGSLDHANNDTTWNDLCRDPRVSGDLYSFGNLGATSPFGPEAFRRELYWIYRSNGHGVYAGDNDYFMAHDLKVAGHRIDGDSTPTYVLAGEYDPISVELDHGGPAVAALFPSVIYRVMPGLSHFAPTDDPLNFRAQTLPVLEEIMERRAGIQKAAE
jgi:pimeloyl-ACP methyl ester carboxylesterase